MSMHPGREAPTPTQSTCLYYDHDNEASKCVQKCTFDPVGTCFAPALAFLILLVCSSGGCGCFTAVDKTRWRISLTLKVE